MAEGRRMDIKSHGQIIRLQLIDLAEKNIQKAVYGTRVDTLRIRQIRHSVKRAVQNTVPVDQQQLFSGRRPACSCYSVHDGFFLYIKYLKNTFISKKSNQNISKNNSKILKIISKIP